MPPFGGSEALTRYALINPMLRELGWDTSDPNMVIPEYSSGDGRADYALLSDGKPVVMVEAKKLDESLQSAVGQGIQYCLMQGTGYFLVTDGRRWEVYETHRPVPIDEKRVVSFDLKGTSAAEACLQALSLWRPSVTSGNVRRGRLPSLGCPMTRRGTPEPQPPVGTVVQPPPDVNEPGWQPLSTLEPVPSRENPSPSEILFPDNSRASIRKWVDVSVTAIRWLMENNHLNAAHCPIKSGKSYILTNSPTFPDGKPMQYYKEINSLYLSAYYNSRNQIRNLRLIIEHVGQDPAQFKVRFP